MQTGHILWSVVVAVAIASVTRTASAEDDPFDVIAHPAPTPTTSPVAPPTPAAPPEVWYGWQTLTVDAFALTTSVAAIGSQNLAISVASAATWVMGTPSVHFLHGHPVRATVSFLVRTLMAPAFAILSSRRDRDYVYAAIVAAPFVLGGAIVTTVDAAIAFDQPVPPVTLTPRIDYHAGEVHLGVEGSF
jgi:hypothetical protein